MVVSFALGVDIPCRHRPGKAAEIRQTTQTESHDHEGKIKAPVPVPGNSALGKEKG